MTTENFALDSFENLIFSLARFREYTGTFPIRITVVGYGMKKSRFEELHAKAIRWPVKGYHSGQRRFHYVGIDDDGDVAEQYDGEKIKGYRMFEKDMYGCHGVLQVSIQPICAFISFLLTNSSPPSTGQTEGAESHPSLPQLLRRCT